MTRWLLTEAGVIVFELVIFMALFDGSMSRRRTAVFTIAANIISAAVAFLAAGILVI